MKKKKMMIDANRLRNPSIEDPLSPYPSLEERLLFHGTMIPIIR